MGFGHFFVDRPIFASVISIVLVIVGLVALRRPADRAVSGDRAADHRGDGAVSRRQRRDDRRDGRRAAGAADQRRRGHDLHELARHRRRRSSSSRSPSSRAPIRTSRRSRSRTGSRRPIRACRRRCGATASQVNKRSSDFLMVVNLISPDKSLDTVYLSNYATVNVVDALKRIEGVGDIRIFGERELSLARLARSRTGSRPTASPSGDVVAAISAQNVQVSGGSLGAPPVAAGHREPDHGDDAGALPDARAVQADHRPRDRATAGCCASATSPASSSRARLLFVELLSRRRPDRRHGRVPAPRHQRHRRRPSRSRRRWRR